MKNIPLFIVITIFLFSCTKPTKDIKLNVSTDVFKYSILLQFHDAAEDGKYPENIQVELVGKDAEKFYEASGSRDFSAPGGMLSLVLDPNVIPADNAPLEFNVKVSAAGYLPVNQKIRLSAKSAQQIENIQMVNLKAPPKGVSVGEKSMPLSNGVLMNADSIITPLTGGKQEWCKIKIDDSTVFYDKNGNALSGATITGTVAHFDTRNPQSLSSYPGGFLADSVADKDQQLKSVFFMTAGFGSIDMDINGVAVKGFNKPITVSMAIDPSIKKPGTQQTIVVGDTIPVWSYDEPSGKWKFETDGVIESISGQLVISFKMNHLTWVNYDWVYYFYYCYNSSVTFNAPGLQGSYDYFIVDIYNSYWSYYPMYTYYTYITNGTTMWLYNYSFMNTQMYAKVSTPYYNNYYYYGYYYSYYWNYRNVVGQGTVSNCGNTSIYLNYYRPPIVTFNLYGVCTQKNNKIIRPTGYLYYKETYSSYYNYLAYVSNGYFSTTMLQLWHTYDFMTYYGGKELTYRSTITSLNLSQSVNLTGSICGY